MTGVPSPGIFSFLWREAKKSTWHRKTIKANTLPSAIEALRAHLAKRPGFPDSLVVDHPVFEKRGGLEPHRLSLTTVASPFQIEHDNSVHPIGHFPESI